MSPTDSEFDDIRRLILEVCGIALGPEKKYLVKSRLEPVMQKHSLGSYADLIRKSKQANGLWLRDVVIEAMTTKETSFNRDTHPFEVFRTKLLPQLIETRLQRQRKAGLGFGKFRIWSAASSTGQEAYSLGIGILEHLSMQPTEDPSHIRLSADMFSIIGTDISSDALKAVRAATYTRWEIDRGLEVRLRDKYFKHNGDTYTAAPELQRMVETRQLNLTTRFADMTGFDLILCRNVLIYFEEAMRQRIVDQLCSSLSPGGILMLGAAESMTTIPNNVEQLKVDRTIVFLSRGR
jgi:chemotaxis protein methyltransferase CheR